MLFKKLPPCYKSANQARTKFLNSNSLSSQQLNNLPIQTDLMRYLFLILTCLFLQPSFAQEYLLESPDKQLKVEVLVSANTVYRVYLRNKLIMHGKPIGMTIGKKNELGSKEFEPKSSTNSKNETVEPVVAYRSVEIREHYNQLSLDFESGLGIDFRCFNEGVAYRLRTSFEPEVTIKEERMGFELTTNPDVWFPKETSFFSHNERAYNRRPSLELKPNEKASLPILW